MQQGWIRVVLTLIVVVVAIFAGRWLWDYYIYSPWTRDARVRADVVSLAADVSGLVTEVYVKDNQKVHKGDLLVEIDKERFQAQRDQAQALVDASKNQYELKRREAHRRTELGAAAVGEETVENSQLNEAIAKSDYMKALADLKTAEINLDRSIVRAPDDGHVTNLKLFVGNYVRTGDPMIALVNSHSYYVLAYLEETKLPYVKEGDRVEIQLMSGSVLQGVVKSISSGIADKNLTGDRQLLAQVEPTFNWVRLAQRIPVRIEFDPYPKKDDVRLSSGLTATVTINPPNKNSQDNHKNQQVQSQKAQVETAPAQ